MASGLHGSTNRAQIIPIERMGVRDSTLHNILQITEPSATALELWDEVLDLAKANIPQVTYVWSFASTTSQLVVL
jgi:hypothetical protein